MSLNRMIQYVAFESDFSLACYIHVISVASSIKIFSFLLLSNIQLCGEPQFISLPVEGYLGSFQFFSVCDYEHRHYKHSCTRYLYIHEFSFLLRMELLNHVASICSVV